MPMPRRLTSAAGLAGSATDGIGIPGSIHSRSFPATGSFTARSDGVSIHPRVPLRHHTFMVARITVTLDRTTMPGVPAFTMGFPPTTGAACTTGPGQVLAESTQDEA